MINLDDLLEGQELDNIRKQVQQNQLNQQDQQQNQQQQIVPQKDPYFKYIPMEQQFEQVQDYINYRVQQEEKLINDLEQQQKQLEKEINQARIDNHQDEVEIRILQKKLIYLQKRKEQIQTVIDNVNDQEDIKQLEEQVKQTQEELDKYEPIESLLKQVSEVQFQLQYLEGVKGLYQQYMNGKSVDDYIEMHEKTKQYLEIIKEIKNTHNDPQFLEKKSSEHQTIVRYSKNLDQYLMKVFEIDQRLKKDIEIQENQIKQLEDQYIYLNQYKQQKRSPQNILQYIIVILIILFQLSLMYYLI